MKRKFAIYLLVSTVLATGAAGGIKVFGQKDREPNRQPNNVPVSPNSGPYQTSTQPFQLPNYPNVPVNPNSGPYQTSAQPYQQPSYPAGGPYSATFDGNNPPIGIPFQSTGPQSVYPMVPHQVYPSGSGVSTQGMIGHVSPRYTVINKDGSIESIEKKPNAKFLKEDFDLINETRQIVEKAVSQWRSSDADESKRKEAKELIAKYLKAEFQADQESRREQVERLEKQVEQLKKQLSKRDESQDKLIELRLQLLENDSSGLSFPESWGHLPGLPPMNSNVPTYSINRGMQVSIPGQTFSNPVISSPSPDVGRNISPWTAPPVPRR